MQLRPIKIELIIMAVFVLMSLAVSTAFGQDSPTLKNGKIQAFVSILPQAYFVERVGGEFVEVTVLVGPGQSPATYDPSPHEIGHLSDANVYFKIGVPFEVRLLEKAKKIIPNLNIIDTQAGIELRTFESHDPHPDHDHHDNGDDPHVWLDPQLVKIQAATIATELKRLMPSHAEEFEANLADFQNDLDKLDAHIAEMMRPYSKRRFYVFHPSYGYFADRYDLNQVAVEVAGKGPGARQLGILTDQAQADGISAIFVQAQFATGPVEAISHEIGVEVVQIDPLARDYIQNLEQMADRIARSFNGDQKDNSSTEHE
jgi:zinc transport system substrate-binding protein